MIHRYDAVMFDLDGTLADTLADIAAAGNHVLTRLGKPPRPLRDYRYLAGQGAPWLVREALGPELAQHVDEGVTELKRFQLERAHALTTLYPGVAELLDELTRRGLKLAVLSNKPDAATKQLVGHLLARWKFAAVRGHREGGPLKPDPAAAVEIARELGVPVERWLYVGDTMVDMKTARGAGMFAVGVLWGFRDEPELREHGADAIVKQAGEILQLL